MLPEVKTNQLACARTPEADRHVNQAEAQWAVAVMKYKDGHKRVDENSEGTYTPYTPYTFGCSVNFRVCNLSSCSSSARWWTIRVPQKISELYSCLVMFNLYWPILIHFICYPITWPTSKSCSQWMLKLGALDFWWQHLLAMRADSKLCESSPSFPPRQNSLKSLFFGVKCVNDSMM